ncbi:MAG: type IV pilin protein [Caldimonas sp.]
MTSRFAVRRHAAGFTTLELLVAVLIACVLSSIAYPSFRGQIDKARRSDAIATLMQAQMAQERWRADSANYGSLGEIGIAAISGAGHYTLAVTSATSSGYEMLATARGAQQRDADCRNLRLGVAGANFVYASGPDAAVANSSSVNRRCWSL